MQEDVLSMHDDVRAIATILSNNFYGTTKLDDTAIYDTIRWKDHLVEAKFREFAEKLKSKNHTLMDDNKEDFECVLTKDIDSLLSGYLDQKTSGTSVTEASDEISNDSITHNQPKS